MAAEIGVGEQVLGRWVGLRRQASLAGGTGPVQDADERVELSGCAVKTPNYVWTVLSPVNYPGLFLVGCERRGWLARGV